MRKNEMEKEQFQELLAKLDRITMLLAISIIRGLKPEDQIMMLSTAGFQPSQIAGIVGKTPNAVRIMLHDLRKKGQLLSAKKTQ
jgi:hypothetical protein